MKNNSIKIIALFLLCIGFIRVSAQQTVPATGGNATGSGGSSSYTVGQVFYTTNDGTNVSSAQGVQQPYEISIVTSIEEAKGITLQFSAYPNPTYDYVKLDIKNYEIKNLTYSLYDSNGKLLENKKIESSEISVTMKSLVPATYYIKVIQGDKEIKIFKIIKVS